MKPKRGWTLCCQAEQADGAVVFDRVCVLYYDSLVLLMFVLGERFHMRFVE
jgi:hypothetical protein